MAIFSIDKKVTCIYTVNMSDINIDNFDYTLDDLVQVKYDFSASTIPQNTIYTTTGINGTWASSSPYVINTGAGSSWTTNPMHVNSSGKIECTGKDADIVLNGKSVRATLEAIEERLAILQPNPELEKEWEELKDLGQRYRTLEAEIKEKMRVWDILKKTE
jgi:hypothetical protein